MWCSVRLVLPGSGGKKTISAHSALLQSNNLFSLGRWDMGSQGDWRRFSYFWTPQSQFISVCYCHCQSNNDSSLILGLEKILQERWWKKEVRRQWTIVPRFILVTPASSQSTTDNVCFFSRTGMVELLFLGPCDANRILPARESGWWHLIHQVINCSTCSITFSGCLRLGLNH